MSKEASKKRREAEARLISDLLAALPAFEMPRRSQTSSSSSNNLQQQRKGSSANLYEDLLSNGVSNMALSISATLPTLRYAAVFARKQALLNSQVLNIMTATENINSGAIKEERIEFESSQVQTNSLIRRSELPGLIIVFDPAKRIYPISNGTPLEVAGEMVYVSENVMTYLGHSVQDILSRADSVYDLLLPEERPKIGDVVTRMLMNHSTEERSFLCRFSNALFTRRVRTMSSDYKLMLVKARLLVSSTAPLVVFSCCPVLTPLYQRDIDFLVHEPGVFTFKCSPELIITRVDNRAGQFLAFEDETELLGRRWLNLIHPDDLITVIEQLRGVLGPNKRDDAATMFVVRMMRAGDESAPTRCIYVSVVLAYRHFGGATLNSSNGATSSLANSQQQPQAPTSPLNGEIKTDDDAFNEACQPSVTITCQVLPENNMEIINEIKKYANPLFNCHGLTRSGGNGVASTNGAVQPANENSALNYNESSNSNSNGPVPGLYRRHNSTVGTTAAMVGHVTQQQHIRRQANHRMSFRSSVTSFDGMYDSNLDAVSTVTAPAMSAMLARRIPPSRRSSVASAPGIAILQQQARMQPSNSDYDLYIAQQQAHQAPVIKRQRTSELMYSDDQQQQSPMSAISYVGTPPAYNEQLPSGNNWTMYQQRGAWDQVSDCSASTGYQQACMTPGAVYISSNTPTGSPAFSAGVSGAPRLRASQGPHFNKNATSPSANHYHQRHSHQFHLQQQLFATSPSSATSMSYADNYNNQISKGNNNSFFPATSDFVPVVPNNASQMTRSRHVAHPQQPVNFRNIAPDVPFSTHFASSQQSDADQQFFSSPSAPMGGDYYQNTNNQSFAAANLHQQPLVQVMGNNYSSPTVQTAWMTNTGTELGAGSKDQWSMMASDVFSQPPAAFHGHHGHMQSTAPSVTQQIHESIARKASVKKVTEWLGFNGANMGNGEIAVGSAMSFENDGATGLFLPELNTEELSIFLDEANNNIAKHVGSLEAGSDVAQQWQPWRNRHIADPAFVADFVIDPPQRLINHHGVIKALLNADDYEDDSGFSVGHSADSPMSAGNGRRQLSNQDANSNNNNNNNNSDINMVLAV